ncbi:ATP-binding protein [Alsobacter sp. SYSU M60028]|uniref:histidine kinase n=1 Tax=Alsobacter ponti TaxID=2962936 RepID=A0ABT1LFD6_9HYPH|nr:ATP-binding protein [Alsobacter ponti]
MRQRASFRTRLALAGAVWIAIGLIASWLVLSRLFEGHAVAEFVDELDHHATELANLVVLDADGALRLSVPLSDHRFQQPSSGYYWQVERPGGGSLRSPSMGNSALALNLPLDGTAQERTVTLEGPTGPVMVLERTVVGGPSGVPLRLAVGSDVTLRDAFLATFKHTLAVSLAFIGLGLVATAAVMIWYGLLPLGRMRRELAAVRRGDAARLSEDLPEEVAPLAASVNALLQSNEEMIRRARLEAGNLAHALKTPLAILQFEGERLSAAGQDGRTVVEQCDRIRRQIDYQLAHARAVASRSSGVAATRLAPALDALISGIERLYRGRGIAFELADLPDDVVVACATEDLDEVMGNLVDNAAKWARSRVCITVSALRDKTIRLCVEDDGPGMPPEARERAFEAGTRIDESTPGTGLGLAIVRDVVSLYGGKVWISTSAWGGVAANVELPVQPFAS